MTDCDHQQSLLSPDDVMARLQAKAVIIRETECVSVSDCLNRVLSETLTSTLDVPPADNSAVDGYALRANDLVNTGGLEISQRIPAGCNPAPLEAGTVARIFTGAHIPDGADCVIMQENARLLDNGKVFFSGPVQTGQNIRPKGQDITSGAIILESGTVMTPQRMGLAASVGKATISVRRRLKVAILSTGDELVEPGEAIDSGQIYNSNRYLLHGLLQSFGFEVVDLGVIPDTLSDTKSNLQVAAQQADVVITTGGASVGEEDHVQSAIRQLGSIELWRVAIKPGKPFMFGEIDATPILGLPGNPGAVLVTFLILARPFLMTMQGVRNTQIKGFPLPLSRPPTKPGIRREYLRVRRNEQGILERHPNQSSGMLSSASWAEGLACIPENTLPDTHDTVNFYPFASLLNMDH